MTALERLTAAGIVPDDLPADITSVLDGLSAEEVDVLIGVADKLATGSSDDVAGFMTNAGRGVAGEYVGMGGPSKPPSYPKVASDGGNSGGWIF